MAVSFATSTQYMYYSSNLPVTANPFSVSCWAKPASGSAAATYAYICAFGNNASGTSRYGFALTGSSHAWGRGVTAFVDNGFIIGSAVYNTSWSDDVWMHVAAVFSSGSLRKVYYNGVSASNTTACTPTAADRFIIHGGWYGGAPEVSGQSTTALAHLAVYDLALTDDQVTALSKGCKVNKVSPNHLSYYAPFTAATSFLNPVIDRTDVNASGPTLTGSPTATNDNPRARGISKHPQPYLSGSAVASSSKPWFFQNFILGHG